MVTLGYYIAFIALGMAAAFLGPTLPGLADQTSTQLSQISILFTASSTGYMVGSYFGGRLYDKVPGNPLMAAFLLLLAALFVLIPLVPLLWLLTAVVFVLGMAKGTVDVGGNVLLVWQHGDGTDPYMNGLHFFFGLGAFLSPIIISQAIKTGGDIRWAFWSLAVLMLPAAVILLRVKSPSHQKVGPVSQPDNAQPLLVALTALFLFVYVGAEVGFGGWIFTYARELGLADDSAAAYLTSAFWGALTAGRLLSIPIATRVRPRTILLVDLLGALVSVAVIMIWPASTTALWLGALGAGLFLASVFPTAILLARRRMTITGKVTGWFLVGASLGGTALPWIIGQLFVPVGPQVTIYAMLVDLVLALAVFFILIAYSERVSARLQSGIEGS